ncbi:MAG: PAS domain S-box protein [Bacteroidetes bacterium]|nr:PAS domain S-box protein [Bacteroidota bacterium]
MILPGQMKVLIVEDNPGDAFLVKEYLNATDIQIDEIHWASGWNEAVEVLESVVIAIVLLDLNLSDSQGLDTFQKFKSIAPNIPVVVLSGHQDKVIAIETMKMGAQDYLVKGTFNAILLGKAINYAIERSCYIKSLWQKEEEYKYLFDNNPNPLLTWEIANLQFSMVNQAAIDFYGLTTTEFLSLKVTDLFEGAEIKSEDLVSKSHLFGKKHLKGGKQLCYVDLVLKDAEIHGVHSRIMLVNDVTQKHLTMEKLIESEQQLRKLAGNYPNGLIAIIDNQFIFHFIDGSELVKKGLAAKDMIGKCYTDFLDEANKQKFIENISKVFIGEQVVFYKEMAEETFLISASGLSNSNGEIVRAILVSQNITGNILAKKEILFQANILKNVIEAIVVKDINGNIVYFNESAEKLLGYPAELIEGKSLNDLIKNEKLDFNFEKILEETALNGTFKHEYRTKRADGSEIVLETAQSFMNNEKGVPAFVIGISQDITDRIEAEKVLKDSEANLNAIFRSTTQSFILMDVDTRIVAFNENGSNALFKFFNKQIKKGDYFRSLIWDSRLKIFENHIREVLDQKMVRFEEKFNFNGEKEVYLELTYSPVMKDDAVIGIVLCGENITERYRSEEFLLKSEQKYRELVETSIDMIWTIDKAGKVVFVNKAANEILGWETVDIIGKNFVDFVGPADVENVSQHIYEALLANKQYSNYESTILRKDGAIANVITHAVVNHD